MIILGNYGGGYHAWDVSKGDMVNFQKASYAVTLVYVPMVFVIKVALLAVMLRLFAPDKHKVMLVYGTIIVLLYYIPALFIKIFFCNPISAYWYGLEATNGTCMDQRKVIIAGATISMISDFWILVLPISMLWSLKMSFSKKLRVLGILGAGGLATGFSIWRLVMMVDESRTSDTTWFWIHCVLTGNAESGTGLTFSMIGFVDVLFAARLYQNYILCSASEKSTNATHKVNRASYGRPPVGTRRSPSIPFEWVLPRRDNCLTGLG
ncbi:hypothetical protein ASPACDRAFT_112756 [Aspergillus aculeatus ATCC 16872]|uniref:Rhodopsin domain-containing protein n=1 Tax=Aspergillus aculeatus (strain ATCC 16872 / CBS 172.66 / WB 5094) TaxID=690307 RepID=A0A1L9X2D0_ASPA1|nr:uncharacterized protein ASPACDRAFT_112756 [Aspergillus aculeatus ATCC 16872]OJK02613.1 hypothetical protein ASPACDRAFT_112756 [Aspergillus aculeatus ATCC 16872]